MNGNFDLLREVIAQGRADCEIVTGFPLERLAERENFLSLLHYFGLLSIRGAAGATPRLGILSSDNQDENAATIKMRMRA